VKQYKKMEY